MAIFNKESEFYKRPTPAPDSSDPGDLVIPRIPGFVVSHVFALTVPVSIAVYALVRPIQTSNCFIDLIALTMWYFGLIASIPGFRTTRSAGVS
jgi:hypothetical protein